MSLRHHLAALLLLLTPFAIPAASGLRNVVVILADDLGAHDLGCTGSTFHETPHLDRLAASGMRFTQAYAACTVCSPTRAALQTGRHPARLHVTDWIKGHDAPKAKLRPPSWTQQLVLEEVTLAERLRGAGKATGHIGKWHLGSEGFEPERQGFDVNLGGDHRGQPPSYFSPHQLPRLVDGPPGEYLTDREGREASDFIRKHRDRPFFLSYCAHAVHTPLQAPSNLVARFRTKAEQASGPQTNATYAAMLERLDAAVGGILAALEESQLTGQTLVIFTSDNGGLVAGRHPPTSNAPLRSGKGSPYEGGHRVPLIIRWPGVTIPGSTSAEPVITMDIQPTALEALGWPTGYIEHRGFDGMSLVPLLRDPQARLNRDALFWHYPHYHPGGATPYAAIRAGDWKLIQYYETGRHELFHLRDDPSEAHNLAESQPERVLALTRRLFAWQGQVGAQWPMANPAWEPEPIPIQPNGTLRLHARDAKVIGEVLRYEPQPFKDTLGWWSRREDSALWTFELPMPGRYSLEILQGCGNGSGGSEVEFAIGDASLTLTVIETGGFQNFTNRVVGDVDLPSGLQTLTVRPRLKPGPAVMDLREVVLRPVTRSP